MLEASDISTNFPFESKFIKINGSRLHYIDEGQGECIVFLHGIPTSSYLWRNIIPTFSKNSRCIAPDLIGMGKSEKPDIPYRIFDHIDYITQFIDALKLKNITFVLHGWGSVIGFHYAMANESRVRALAFYESHLRPVLSHEMLSLPVQQFASLLRNEKASYRAIVGENYFINKLLPRAVLLRKLSNEELAYYAEPYQTPESRKPLWQYVRDLPLGNGPEDVIELIADYSRKLQASPLPKLLMYTIPGFMTTVDTIVWARKHLSNLELADLGHGLHFIQEGNPAAFREALASWYSKLE